MNNLPIIRDITEYCYNHWTIRVYKHRCGTCPQEMASLYEYQICFENRLGDLEYSGVRFSSSDDAHRAALECIKQKVADLP